MEISGRPHGLTVFFSLKKYFWALAVPIIRAVLALGFDLESAFRGYGADIAVTAVLLAYAFSKWLFCTVSVCDSGISVTKGLILKKRTEVSFDKTCCVNLYTNPLARMFGCIGLSVHTDTGHKPVIRLYCRKETAQAIKTAVGHSFCGEAITCGFKSILYYAIISSRSKNGLLFLAAVLSYIGIAVGKSLPRLAEEHLGQVYSAARSTAGLVIILGAVAFLGWITALAMNILAALRLSVQEKQGSFLLRKGIVKKTFSAVYGADYRVKSQSLFLPGRVSIAVGRFGFGSDKYDVNTVLPAVKRNKVSESTADSSFLIRPASSSVTSFALPRLAVFSAVCLICGLGYGFGILGGIIALILPAPLLMKLAYSMYDYCCSGAEISGNKISVSYADGSLKRTVDFDKSRCGKIIMRQNPFQRRKSTADIRFFIKGAGRLKVRVRHADSSLCRQFCHFISF